MQFRLSAATPSVDTIQRALKPLDADAHITVDAHEGLLEVISTITTKQIVLALGGLGIDAEPLDEELHISGGSTCCGGCS